MGRKCKNKAVAFNCGLDIYDYICTIKAYKGHLISTVVDAVGQHVGPLAYKGHLISTVVDVAADWLPVLAYKGHLISTVVDHDVRIKRLKAYKGHLISTVVDIPALREKSYKPIRAI